MSCITFPDSFLFRYAGKAAISMPGSLPLPGKSGGELLKKTTGSYQGVATDRKKNRGRKGVGAGLAH
jgi:hypothetical protein